MFLLWFVGFVISFVIGVGILFVIKRRPFINRTGFVIIGLISAIVGIGYANVFYIPINLGIYQFWLYLVFLILLYLILFVFFYELVYDDFIRESNTIRKQNLKRVIIGVSILLVVLFVTTSSLTRATAVSSLIKFEKADQNLFKKIEPKKVRLVPKETAIMLADKTLGSESKNGVVLGSQLEIDKKHTTIQKIGNSLYWVVPLGYKGIFKQFSFGDIPGYVLVDAYDPNKPAVFKDGFKIKYSLDAYFSRWAKRKLWLDDVTSVLADFSFEVDDKFRPYIVATVLKPMVGFGKFMPVGVKILDVQTGQINYYPLSKVPSWVDRVIPQNIIAERIDEKGKWHNGIISALFTGNGTWQLTNYGNSKEMFFVEDGAGKTYWVSGITSTGKDNSIIALVAVNTRTGKSYWIPMTGPTETAVKDVVESSLGVNKSVWQAKLPILYNIYGKLVWVTVVIDKNRAFPIKYALVDSKNITHYVIKKSFNQALVSFFQNVPIPGIKKEIFIYSGNIERFNISDGYLYFWAADKVWQCSILKYPLCAVVKKGDVVFSTGFKKGKVVWVQKFEDKNITR